MTGVEVQSVLAPDGEPVVELFVDRGRRWVKSKPVYLAQHEARQLAHELLAVALDEELAKLEEAADNTTSAAEHERLVMLRDMVRLMRRMFPEPAHD